MDVKITSMVFFIQISLFKINFSCFHSSLFILIRIFAPRYTKKAIKMSIDKVSYWIEIADYDLETAEAMFSTQRWLYVAFMCHQTIEKTLKAYWCGTMPEDPPYTHNHMRLADGCALYDKMTEEQKETVKELSVRIISGIETFATGGPERAMNLLNAKNS